jgi:hypothetical protein
VICFMPAARCGAICPLFMPPPAGVRGKPIGMALHVENTSLGMPMRDSAASVTV